MARSIGGIRAMVGEFDKPFDDEKYFLRGIKVARNMRENRRLDLQEKKIQRDQEQQDAALAQQQTQFETTAENRIGAAETLAGTQADAATALSDRRTTTAETLAGTRAEAATITDTRKIEAEERARGDETFTTDEAIRKEQELQAEGLKPKPLTPQETIDINRSKRAAPKPIDKLRARIASGELLLEDATDGQRRLLGKAFMEKSEEDQLEEAQNQGIKMADLWVATQDYNVEPEEYQDAVDRFTKSYYEDMQEAAQKRKAVGRVKGDLRKLKTHTERTAAKSEKTKESAKETKTERKTFNTADLKAVQKAKKAKGESFTIKQLRELFEGKGLKFK
jgi:hypothetical protein